MKLIILNGSPAAGKSTIAARLHKDLPMSLLADVDTWRKLISGWRENRERSLTHAYSFTVAAVDAYLATGNSVIVDKAILNSDETIEQLVELGKKRGAQVHEFILTAQKDTIIGRAEKRGFREGGLLTLERVHELWEEAEKLKEKRPSAIVVNTTHLTADEVYQHIRDAVFRG